jgi:hypothetical protein
MKALKAATVILAVSHIASAALASETKPAVSCENRRDSGTAVAPVSPAGGTTAVPDDLKPRQRQAAWRKRRIIMNNDGNDCFGLTTDHKNIHEEFLKTRTSPLAGSQVDAIFYCTGVFNSYSHDSRESELQSCGLCLPQRVASAGGRQAVARRGDGCMEGRRGRDLHVQPVRPAPYAVPGIGRSGPVEEPAGRESVYHGIEVLDRFPEERRELPQDRTGSISSTRPDIPINPFGRG